VGLPECLNKEGRLSSEIARACLRFLAKGVPVQGHVTVISTSRESVRYYDIFVHTDSPFAKSNNA